MQALVLCIVATVGLVAVDLWTKDLALEHLSRERVNTPPVACDEGGLAGMQRFPTEPYVVAEGYLELRYAENCGAAFGLLDDAPRIVRRAVFGTAGIAATVFLFLLFIRGSGGSLFAASVPLIVSGAVGNLVDRARLEYVVDFIRFHIQDSFEYPTFNVADITITVGVVLLVIDGFREEALAKKRAKAEVVAAAPVTSATVTSATVKSTAGKGAASSKDAASQTVASTEGEPSAAAARSGSKQGAARKKKKKKQKSAASVASADPAEGADAPDDASSADEDLAPRES